MCFVLSGVTFINASTEVVLETVIKKGRLVGKKVDMFQAVRKHTGDHEGEMRWRKKGREVMEDMERDKLH